MGGFYASGTKNGKPLIGYSSTTPLIRVQRIVNVESFAQEMRKARAEGKICLGHQTLGEKQEVFDPVVFASVMAEAKRAGLISVGEPITPIEPEKPRIWPLEQVECVICAQMFSRRKNQAVKTCSVDCGAVYRSQIHTAKQARMRPRREPKKCHCGKPTRPGAVACSRECSEASRVKAYRKTLQLRRERGH
jgi:hypothetical protein